MKPDATAISPMVLELVVRINQILTGLDMTQDQFRMELNNFLPAERQIKSTHSGAVKLSKMLNPTGFGWNVPNGEMTLAMQKTKEILEKRLTESK